MRVQRGGLWAAGLAMALLGPSCEHAEAAPAPAEAASADEPVGWWSRVSAVFRRSIDDCEDLRDWLADEGRQLRSTVEADGGTWVLTYAPMAARYCLADADAYGSVEEPTATILDRGRRSAMYILEVRPGQDAAWTDDPLPTGSVVAEVLGTDTLPCALLHREPLPPSTGFKRYLLGFDRPEDARDRSVVIHRGAAGASAPIVIRLRPGAVQAFEALNTQRTLVQWGD